MMIKLLVHHTGMCIKGPKSWWIAKSITSQLMVNQSKINPQRPNWFATHEVVIDFAIHQLLGPLISTILNSKNLQKWFHPIVQNNQCNRKRKSTASLSFNACNSWVSKGVKNRICWPCPLVSECSTIRTN